MTFDDATYWKERALVKVKQAHDWLEQPLKDAVDYLLHSNHNTGSVEKETKRLQKAFEALFKAVEKAKLKKGK